MPFGLGGNFFGGAGAGDEDDLRDRSQVARDRFGNSSEWATGQRDHLSQYGNDIRQRGTERGDFMWDQLWGEGGTLGMQGGGSGNVAYRGDPNSIWGELRDSGDLTGGDWDSARDTYNEYNETGGWDEDRQRDFRARAIAGTDMYDPSANAQSRVQGGWGAGGGANDLARQKAISEMRRRGSFEAESDIAAGVDQGRRWGASSLEGLGGRVQEGRITGQSQLDAERRRRNANARANANANRTNQNDMWNRSMSLMGFDQSRLGQVGADLAYDQAGQQAAGAGWGVALGEYDAMAARPGMMNQIASAADDLRSMGPPQYGGGGFRGLGGQSPAVSSGGGGGGGGGMGGMPIQMPMGGG